MSSEPSFESICTTLKAAVATLRSLVLVILAAGAVLGFMAIGLVGTAIALLTRL